MYCLLSASLTRLSASETFSSTSRLIRACLRLSSASSTNPAALINTFIPFESFLQCLVVQLVLGEVRLTEVLNQVFSFLRSIDLLLCVGSQPDSGCRFPFWRSLVWHPPSVLKNSDCSGVLIMQMFFQFDGSITVSNALVHGGQWMDSVFDGLVADLLSCLLNHALYFCFRRSARSRSGRRCNNTFED